MVSFGEGKSHLFIDGRGDY